LTRQNLLKTGCNGKLECQVCFFLPSLRGGGAERAVVALANGLVQSGMTVSFVVASKGIGEEYLAEIDNRIKVHFLGVGRIMFAIIPLVFFLKSEKPSVIVSALTHANVVALGAVKLASCSTKAIATERVNYSAYMSRGESLRDVVMRKMAGLLYKSATVVAVSQGVARDCEKVFGLPSGSVHVIYNPVVTPGIREKMSESHPLMEQLGSDKKIILGAGRLVHQKGFDVLLRAFQRLINMSDLGSRCELVIIGEGPLRHDLEAMAESASIRDKVHFPGFLNNPFSLMRRANVFVLASRSEGLPNVLIQAMACGTPVVATNCPSGPFEILEGGKWGDLIPVDNVDLLASAMIKALEDAGPAPQVKQRAEYFSLDRAVDQYRHLIVRSLSDVS
jgi:glycosyltransferase involved in cell wall biosynthesis